MSAEGRPASRFAGLGANVPEKILTNEDLERMVDTSDEWITARTGIKRRHIVEPGTSGSVLATAAAKQALEDAEITPDQLDMIIVGTVTGDYKFPSTAIFIQDNLQAKNAVAFDISATCSAWIFTTHFADLAIRTGQAKTVLAIGVEVLTSITDWTDRSTCVLFGDGAGATVVVPSDDHRGLQASYLGTDGRLAKLLYCYGGGSLKPGNVNGLPREEFALRMSGNEVFKHAVKTMGDAAEKALKLADISSEQLDLLIPHQANLRIIDATARRLKVPREKVYINIDEYGNTSAASIPIAIKEAHEKGLIGEGSLVATVAFGGGFTWGSSVIRF